MLPQSLLILAILLVVEGQETSKDSTLRKLRQHILTGYDVNSRPVFHHDNTTTVEAALKPIHITALNENTGILTLEGWLVMSWHDEHLKWDPKNFSGLAVIRLPDKEVWKPDLALYNGRGSHIVPFQSVNVLVYNSGHVMWIPPASMQLICESMDYTNYPQDTQKCKLKLGSWTHDGNQIDLKLGQDNLTLSDYSSSSNPHWEVTHAEASRLITIYACCEEPYVTLNYELSLKRRNVPFSALCTVPDTVARILILCMFWIPNGMRKLLLGCTSLLTLTLIAASVTSSLPSPAAAPAALSEINAALALCIAAIIVEIAVSAISNCGLDSPAILERLVSSTFCRVLNPCEASHGPPVDVEYKEEIMESPMMAPKKRLWPFLASVIDHLAFVVFAVLLMAM